MHRIIGEDDAQTGSSLRGQEVAIEDKTLSIAK
jgi:hypothetical protein